LSGKIPDRQLRGEALLHFALKEPDRYKTWKTRFFNKFVPLIEKGRPPVKRVRLEEGKRRAPPPVYTPGPGPEDENGAPVRPLDE